MFHNLYKGTGELPNAMKNVFPEMNEKDDNIYAQSAYRIEDIKQNHIMIADNKLLDEVYGL